MSNQIKLFNTTDFKPIPKKKIIDSVRFTFDGESIFDSNVKIILVSDDNIHELNKRFLKHNRSTDVITFNLDEQEIDGEIYISIDTAKVQAEEYKVTLTQELMRLSVHGALHLAGYNDKTKREKIIMTKLENRYISETLEQIK